MEIDYLDTAVQAARAAGQIQREKLWGEYAIDFKGEKNLVTEVDRLSEDVILCQLRAACPDCNVLAEESGALDTGNSLRWIVDPLDGTTNYAHGFPWFAVSIALEVSGEIHLGVVYHPMMNELFTCVRGRGAWLNGRKISVSRRQPLKSCMLATGFPYDRAQSNENNFTNFIHFQLAARAVRRAGAAALDLAYVAAGRLDGFWECKLNPWDVAAGKLLVVEAGGTVTNYANEPYSIADHRILASNGLIHQEMLQVLASGKTLPT
ncbi:MAG: inositol monophosphatase family protein [Geobacteraceae bacterium]|nr:inositol monophosphatase family protein [Geobacteraceae bacterium]